MVFCSLILISGIGFPNKLIIHQLVDHVRSSSLIKFLVFTLKDQIPYFLFHIDRYPLLICH